jgi:hypothetical protein
MMMVNYKLEWVMTLTEECMSRRNIIFTSREQIHFYRGEYML